ncbi:sensor histidine kinase [Sphingomonas sp. ABOLG]|nr:sensor histidine kinase [Sphingomonas sp. ABOLG]
MRLASLGGAVEQLLSSDWQAAPLPALADQALAHLSFYTERLSFVGETVRIGPRAAMTLTLAFHELATNAIKYGAL